MSQAKQENDIIFDSLEYSGEHLVIAAYYENKVARRSNVPLINHIVEGCELLKKWKPDNVNFIRRAFCLHPLVQNNIDIDLTHYETFELATEYAEKANSYLCRPDTDWLIIHGDAAVLQTHLGEMSKECAWMLLADKVQNQKDFRTYHWFNHERSDELEAYFNLWIKTLKTYYI